MFMTCEKGKGKFMFKTSFKVLHNPINILWNSFLTKMKSFHILIYNIIKKILSHFESVTPFKNYFFDQTCIFTGINLIEFIWALTFHASSRYLLWLSFYLYQDVFHFKL